MYRLRRPALPVLEELAAAARSWPLQTPQDPLRDAPGRAWNRDRYEVSVVLPAGAAADAVRRAAQETLTSLEFFPAWMVTHRRGDVAVVGARCLGLWGVFANRIIEERAEADDLRGRFDLRLTYATLAGHFETGVETFRVLREDAGAPVRFEIEAVSRVAGWWKEAVARVAVRGLQRRFGRDATEGFARALRRRLGLEPGISLPRPPGDR